MNGVLINIPFGHLEKSLLLYIVLIHIHILKLVVFTILLAFELSSVLLLLGDCNIHNKELEWLLSLGMKDL